MSTAVEVVWQAVSRYRPQALIADGRYTAAAFGALSAETAAGLR